MEWYNILAVIIGSLGGASGLVSWYKAKSEKTTIDIENMQQMLEEAHKMFDKSQEDKQELRKEFADYKKENSEYVKDFKHRFFLLEGRLSRAEAAIYQGYKCPFPKKVDECPVLVEYNKVGCETCINNKLEQEYVEEEN
jgi:soluble cytochrome b562